MKIFDLSENYQIKLDDEDYEKIIKFKWKVQRGFRLMQYGGEIIITHIFEGLKIKTMRLERLVLNNPPKDYTVKFRDGDKFNMQKRNLYLTRFCKFSKYKNKKI